MALHSFEFPSATRARSVTSLTTLALAVAAAVACPLTASAQALAPTAANAVLANVQGQPGGRAMVHQLPDGIEVLVEVAGLAPGEHGIHIHANGSCEPGPDAATGHVVPFGAAGGHFDPMATRNHGHPSDAHGMSHAGELPNITVGADGRGRLSFTNPRAMLAGGKTAVLGRTIVVHERADDYQSDPAGNSGGRVLCGVIQPANGEALVGRATFEGSNVFPEGIAVDTTGTAYVGSSSEGHIYRIAPGSTRAEMLSTGGSPGRMAAYGMKVDAQQRLWVAGGPTGTLALVDTRNGATLAMMKAPAAQQTFINDLVLSRDGHAYVTDSFRPVLYRVRNVAAGESTALEPWLDLSATPIRYVPNQFNLNGITVSPDGRMLLAIQSVTGQLWRIDTRTKAVTQVRVDGDLKNGDGLVLDGNELYVVRNVERQVARVTLNSGWTEGRVTQRMEDARLKYPTTAAMTPQGLMVVNAQTDKMKDPPPLLPFDTVTLQKP